MKNYLPDGYFIKINEKLKRQTINIVDLIVNTQLSLNLEEGVTTQHTDKITDRHEAQTTQLTKKAITQNIDLRVLAVPETLFLLLFIRLTYVIAHIQQIKCMNVINSI